MKEERALMNGVRACPCLLQQVQVTHLAFIPQLTERDSERVKLVSLSVVKVGQMR